MKRVGAALIALSVIYAVSCHDWARFDYAAEGSDAATDGGKDATVDGCVPKSCKDLSANCGKLPTGCGTVIDCGTCPTGETCGASGANTCGTGTCTPKSCATLGLDCGAASDGCGGQVSCGTCAAPAVCQANHCMCTPDTCAALGFNCGTSPDGCGGTLDCGTCGSTETCGAAGPNKCGIGPCTKTTCAAKAKDCGSISDDCGGTLDCGSCSAPQSCGGGGTTNVCGCTPLTCGTGQCGSPPDGCNGTLSCPPCGAGETCSLGNLCVSALKPNGATCSGASECQSNICSKSVCCSVDCSGKCSQCASSGVGCVIAGTDPSCPGNGSCSAIGVCACENGQLDPKESDVDCGGSCLPDKKCDIDENCSVLGSPGGDVNCQSDRCCQCGTKWICKLFSAACTDQGCL